MLDILAITGPIYVVIALGYFLTRWGFFQKSDMRAFGTFVVKVSFPALLFNALSQRQVSDILNVQYLWAYALSTLLTLGLVLLWSTSMAGRSRSLASCYAIGITCPNSGFVGYPVILLSLGPIAGVTLALNMVVENLLILPLLLAWADSEKGSGKWRDVLAQTFKGMALNPMIWGIVVGFVFAVMQWRLPPAFSRSVDLFSQSSGALALFVIGGSLVGLQVKGVRVDVAKIAMGKLLLHPLVAWVVLMWLAPISDPVLRTAALMTCAMPMLGIYSILTQKHGHEGLSAAALLGTTMASFVTLNLLLWMLQKMPM